MPSNRLFAGAALLLTLTACGVSPASSTNLPLYQQSVLDQLNTQSTKGLLNGFDQINRALFNKIDVNHDGVIDEDEAGPYISLDDFRKVDLTMDDVIDYHEFVMWGTSNPWWIGWAIGKHDTPQAFASRMRGYLAERFEDLDSNENGYLEASELSQAALEGTYLGLDYPKFDVQVHIKDISDAEFHKFDKLGIGMLTPSEFEDLFIDVCAKAINPPPPAPTPAPSPKPSAAPASASAPVAGTSFFYRPRY